MGYLGRRCYRQGSSSLTTFAPSLSHTHFPFHAYSLALSHTFSHARTHSPSFALSFSHLRSVGSVEGLGGVGVGGGFDSASAFLFRACESLKFGAPGLGFGV